MILGSYTSYIEDLRFLPGGEVGLLTSGAQRNECKDEEFPIRVKETPDLQ